jgi:hypothetical protein
VSTVAEFSADAAVLVIYVYVLRMGRRPWPLCFLPGVLFFLADTPILSGRSPSFGVRLLALTASLALLWLWPDDDQWKKLWGKLKSQALTAVNAARFNQQVKEAST